MWNLQYKDVDFFCLLQMYQSCVLRMYLLFVNELNSILAFQRFLIFADNLSMNFKYAQENDLIIVKQNKVFKSSLLLTICYIA